MRKDAKKQSRDKKKKSREPISTASVKLPSPSFKSYDQLEKNDFVYGFPSTQAELAKEFLAQLTIVKWGVRIGATIKGKLIPDHELAMNLELNEGFKRVELSRSDALHFLKGETFSIDAPQGWVIVTYQNLPLGWIKSLGNRFNNYYPK